MLGRLGRTAIQVLITFRAGTDRGHDDHDCKLRAPKMLDACKIVILAERTQLRSLVVGGKSGSRDEVYPIPKVGLLENRPEVSGGQEKT